MSLEYTDQLALSYDPLWRSVTVEESEFGSAYRLRENLVKKYAWAIPTEDALAKLAEIQPLVEIGAGTGYWAYELRKRDVEIHAYDQYPPDGEDLSADELELYGDEFEQKVRKNWYHRGHPAWTEVLQGTPDVLKSYSAEWNLFLCWPPMSDMAAYALGYYRGKYIAYVGESSGGCTGNKMFFRLLDRLYERVDEASIPQWPGLHDYLTIYERRGR